jgi:O-succinylhomoserine sulfhydrylase
MVHGGTLRSQFGETSEAMFLTQGFVYDSAEAAEARFKGEDDGFIYSRYANPTNEMFEQRMCLLEGAEAARSTASGMAAIAAALLCQVKAGDHVVSARALFGSCRWIVETLLPQIRRRDDAGRRHVTRPMGSRRSGPTPRCSVLRKPDQSDAGSDRHRPCVAVANRSARRWWSTMSSPRRSCRSRWSSASTSSSTRRPSISTARAAASAASCWRDKDWIDENLHDYFRHTGPSMSPFNAWVMLKGLETLPLRVRADRERGKVADFLATRPAIKRVIYPGRPTIRRPISSPADEGRLDTGRSS